MEKLKLPIIKGPVKESKSLSMDEYLKFVEFNLKHAFERRTYRKMGEMLEVNVPFVIK